MPIISGATGGGAGVFSVATVTLTNAQIKALPSPGGEVELVAAAGAGKVIVPVLAYLHLTWAADYTNISADSVVKFQYAGGGGTPLASFLEAGLGDVTNLLADGASHPAYSALRLGVSGAITVAIGQFEDDPIPTNAALQIVASNTGAYTGGNAGNSLKVSVYYATFTN